MSSVESVNGDGAATKAVEISAEKEQMCKAMPQFKSLGCFNDNKKRGLP